MEMPKNIELDKPFTIEKGNRKRRWKIINHPYFDNAFALISDHIYIRENNFMSSDYNHIVSGGMTIEKTYENAYDHT